MTTERTVYRCKRCGKLAAPHQILPNDDGPPQEDCGCYMGPKWERGVWISVEVVGAPAEQGETDA